MKGPFDKRRSWHASPDPRHAGNIRRDCARILPSPVDVALSETWGGTVTTMSDDVPIADLATGDAPAIDPRAFRPERFTDGSAIASKGH